MKKGTSFKGPAIGTKHPKGSIVKRNADGTISVVSRKKGKKK